jgi:hypothetical protein
MLSGIVSRALPSWTPTSRAPAYMNRGTTMMSTTAAPESLNRGNHITSLQTMLLSDTPMIQQIEFGHHVSFFFCLCSTNSCDIWAWIRHNHPAQQQIPIDGTAQPTRIVVSALPWPSSAALHHSLPPGTTGLTAAAAAMLGHLRRSLRALHRLPTSGFSACEPVPLHR